MKRGNIVLIMGTLTRVRVGRTRGNGVPVVSAVLLDEDVTAEGTGAVGVPVVAYGRLAREVEAFYRNGVSECAVLGWLRWHGGKLEVVADRVTFVAAGAARRQAALDLDTATTGGGRWKLKLRGTGRG